ncbi:hypothetical protein HAX54_033323 [Datura stramonium]|uniref:Uncharacterized protein n=1 Tax=Datura stramonium TaxID=4076 RepID=A0ABS8SDE4_DATST|nr:hypothetical protein [Datura stramonium]
MSVKKFIRKHVNFGCIESMTYLITILRVEMLLFYLRIMISKPEFPDIPANVSLTAMADPTSSSLDDISSTDFKEEESSKHEGITFRYRASFSVPSVQGMERHIPRHAILKKKDFLVSKF